MYAIALIFASGFEIAKFTNVRLIKTHGHVSAAKKAMWCTSVLLEPLTCHFQPLISL